MDAACSELRTYATLRHAGTYRDVLAVDGAVETLVGALGRRLDERDEDDEGLEEGLSARELFDRRVAEDASFSTDAVFGEGGWREGGPPPWCCTGAPCCTRPGPPLSTSPKIHCGEHAAK